MWKPRTLVLSLLVLLAGAGGYFLLAGGSAEPAMAGIETPFPGIPGDSELDQPSGEALTGESADQETSGRVEVGTLDLGWGSVGNLTFQGRVVTPKGIPVPSSLVQVSLMGGRRRRGPAGNGTGKAQTGEDGRFKISLLGRIPSFWVVSARHAGLAPVSKSGVSRPGRPVIEVGDLVLGPGGVLSGVVMDRDGNPVPGATVRWTPFGGRGFFWRGGPGIPGLPPLETQTNPAGLFQLVHVPRGEGKLLATHPAHPPGRSPLIRLQDGTVQDGIRILLPPGYVLEGRVLAQGKGPLPGAQVRALSFGGGGPGFRRGPSPSAKTDGEGRFKLPALPKGTYLVTAGAEGWQSAFQWVSLGGKAPAPPPLALTLKEGRVLEGRVIDEKGNPLEFFSLLAVPQRLTKDALPPLPKEVRKKLQDNQGGNSRFSRFRLSRNDRGGSSGRSGRSRRPRAGGGAGGPGSSSRGGNADQARRIQQILDRIRRRRGNIPPDMLKRIQGFLSSSRNRRSPDPLSEVQSRVMGEMRFRRPKPSRHPGGTFRVQGLLPGVYRIEVEAPGYLRKRSDPLDLSKEVKITGVTLSLEPVLAITGRVLAQGSGEPVEGARVFAVPGEAPKDGNAGRGFRGRGRRGFRGRGNSDRTDRNGNFRIDGLSPGKWHLVAMGSKYGMAGTPTIVLERGKKPAPVEIRVPQGAVVEGRVTGWRAEELPRLTVAAFGPDRRPHMGAVDEQGAFELEGLSPGEWRIMAVSGDFRTLFRAFFRRGGNDPGQVKIQLAEGQRAQVRVPVFRPLWGALSGTLYRGGLPAAGYQVRLVPVPQPTGNAPPDQGRQGGPGGRRGRRGPFGRFGRGPRTEVDIQGAFFFPDVDAGAYTLEGSKNGREWLPLGKVQIPAGQTIQVALTWPVGSVEGLVLLNGAPLPGARVRLRRVRGSSPPGPAQVNFSSSSLEGKTNKEGRYKIKDVPPGSYTVEVRGKKRARAFFGPIQVFPDQVTRRDFSWNVCDLRVQVVDAQSGAPVKRAFLVVRPAGDSSNGGGRRRFRRGMGFGRTDSKGVAHLKNLQEGDVRITVFSRDHGRAEIPFHLAGGAPNQLRIPMKKQASRPRSGSRNRSGPGRRSGRNRGRGSRGG